VKAGGAVVVWGSTHYTEAGELIRHRRREQTDRQVARRPGAPDRLELRAELAPKGALSPRFTHRLQRRYQGGTGAALASQPWRLNGPDAGNQWALVANYTARVSGQCVAAMTPNGRPGWRRSTRSSGTSAMLWSRVFALTKVFLGMELDCAHGNLLPPTRNEHPRPLVGQYH
jgi:hypothetical protein